MGSLDNAGLINGMIFIMSLTNFFDEPEFPRINAKKELGEAEPVEAAIRHLRYLVLTHSYIYYELNETVVSDDKWQEWANELRDIQNAYPEKMKIGVYDDLFKDWNGDTGCHLKYDDRTKERAKRILDYERQRTNNP